MRNSEVKVKVRADLVSAESPPSAWKMVILTPVPHTVGRRGREGQGAREGEEARSPVSSKRTDAIVRAPHS